MQQQNIPIVGVMSLMHYGRVRRTEIHFMGICVVYNGNDQHIHRKCLFSEYLSQQDHASPLFTVRNQYYRPKRRDAGFVAGVLKSWPDNVTFWGDYSEKTRQN